jgi:carbon starvation protein
MLALIFLGGVAVLVGGYIVYGRFLDRRFDVSPERPVPSRTEYDGVDYVAAMAFGWLPAFLWILIGTVLIGGVHDYTALVASIRHRGRSVGEMTRSIISPAAQKIFIAFIWLALIYVLVVFLDLTASTFTAAGGVATSSILFIGLAVLFGFAIYRLRLPTWLGTLVFVPLVFVGIFVGQKLPLAASSLPVIAGSPARTWTLLLLAYCYVASVTPVWILLQPRDYLSSFLLYATVVASGAGLLFGGFPLRFEAFQGFSTSLGPIFPILFVTIACGAVSGFHSIVSSGTTAKQLGNERDVKRIGYGAMAAEGVVALIALATVAMLAAGGETVAAYKANQLSATAIFARGMGRFTEVFGIPSTLGTAFGALAISTFLLTTLDTCTRLGRFLFQEFFGIERVQARFLSSLATLAMPTLFAFLTFHDPQGNVVPVWKAVWPVFGATNQLLAGLTLLVVTVWLHKLGKRGAFVIVPMVFMLAVTLSSLAYLVVGARQNQLVEGISIALFVLAVVMVALGLRALRGARAAALARGATPLVAGEESR